MISRMISRIFLPLALLVAVSTCGAGCAVPGPPNQSTAAEAIWRLEQAYWEYNRDADYEKIVDSWHDRFLGWPDAEPQPIDKEEGKRYVRRLFTEPASYTFEIERAGVQIKENVAVNHYTVHITTNDASGEDSTKSMRITHTWLWENGAWKVLGGMSNAP